METPPYPAPLESSAAPAEERALEYARKLDRWTTWACNTRLWPGLGAVNASFESVRLSRLLADRAWEPARRLAAHLLLTTTTLPVEHSEAAMRIAHCMNVWLQGIIAACNECLRKRQHHHRIFDRLEAFKAHV